MPRLNWKDRKSASSPAPAAPGPPPPLSPLSPLDAAPRFSFDELRPSAAAARPRRAPRRRPAAAVPAGCAVPAAADMKPAAQKASTSSPHASLLHARGPASSRSPRTAAAAKEQSTRPAAAAEEQSTCPAAAAKEQLPRVASAAEEQSPRPTAATKVPVPPDAEEAAAVLARVRQALAARAAGAGGARTRGRGGTSHAPILVEMAATQFAHGLPAPAATPNGFVDIKGWLRVLVAPAAEALWREAIWTLSAHVRDVEGDGFAGLTADMRLLARPGIVSAFANTVTRAAMAMIPGMEEQRISPNAWRQARENDTPLNLFKIAYFFVALQLWNETGSQAAKDAADAAIARVRESSGVSVDESGLAIVQRLSELYFDEHLLPLPMVPAEPFGFANNLVRVPTH